MVLTESGGRGAWLLGGGESGALMRSIDWARTPLGPVHQWPTSLKTMVSVMLHSRHPMFLWWGPELIQLYNDAYLPSFGKGKHPAAMGQPGRECWAEIWPIIGPQIDDVMSRDKASWNEDQLVPILRNGRLEELYWTYGYSSVYDEQGRVSGTLVVCTETTVRVVAERRLRTLQALSEKTSSAATTEMLGQAIDDALKEALRDLPFALFFLYDRKTGEPRLAPSAGPQQALDSAFVAQLAAKAREAAGGGLVRLPVSFTAPNPNEWLEPVTEAFVAPLRTLAAKAEPGFLVFGLSPRLPFDAAYQRYLAQLAENIARVCSRLEAARARGAADAERHNFLMQAPMATAVLIGPDHVFTLANPLYCALVGRTDLVGKSYAQAFPELVGTELPGVLDRVYQKGEPFGTQEYPVALDLRGQGTIENRIFKFNLEPLRDLSGQVYGMMAVASDITAEVESRVLKGARIERERLLTDLQAASRAKDEFLAMLGHELRNPLAPIATAVQLMKQRDDPRSQRELLIVERQVAHLGRLVDDLLDVSRIARGKIELKKRPVEVSEIVLEAVEIASPLLEQRSHALEVQVPRTGLVVDGDPMRLAQVIANLLTNAANYTPSHGRIVVTAARAGSQAVIRVIDNGMGIPPELLPTIFDLFVQGRRTIDRGEGGLGLGLALVKNLASLHGGTVEVKSAGLDRGSEFIVRLPCLDTAAPLAVPAPALERRMPKQRNQRVLVVDDNLDAAEMLSELLRAAGHEVVTANDGIHALSLLEEFDADVGVLDLGLPIIDGFELARRILRRDGKKLPRLIALTGYGQAQDIARSKAAGFEAHLVKPVDLALVLKAIDGA